MPAAAAVSSPFANPNALMSQVDGALRYFGQDLTSIIKNFDLKTLGTATIVVVLAILLFDLVASFFATPGSYPVFGRSLTSFAAQAWKERPNVQGR